MAKAKHGDTVKVHYTGKLKDGRIFDDSLNREPLEFLIGSNRLIPGFENAVIGMEVGEWKSISISCEEAYGPHRPELVMRVERKKLPKGMVPEIGQQLLVSQDEDQPIAVSVVAIDDTHLTIDANHPLAGQDIVFDLRLVEIIPPCSCCP